MPRTLTDLKTRHAPWPSICSRGGGRGCEVWLRHPVPHLGSGYRPPNKPCALSPLHFKAKQRPPPTLRGRTRVQVHTCLAGSQSWPHLPWPTSHTQGPSFMPLLLNELGARTQGQTRAGPGGRELVCMWVSACLEPSRHIIRRGQS